MIPPADILQAAISVRRWMVAQKCTELVGLTLDYLPIPATFTPACDNCGAEGLGEDETLCPRCKGRCKEGC
jgi:hypothetical protein